jgi:HD-GYP domain-containing protein (c-di-GMP phosphodiesterase class II)
VADAFQAMIEPRPYRAPRTRDSALSEVVSQAGGQFDPACVEALRAVV